ncbi:hypothetical protein Ahy_A05g023191 [Arachis hypogaea]|uniref:Uncharacterized protein n=1 Tax=Arachis hypogaea TaxID=3818 RepID=A0A445D2M4_ARAHY|nr:hypothetical protein Ahy_A05g023191 [Arachis hypogaea]
MQSLQRNIGARRKALKENKKATDGPSTIKTNTNGATGSRSKYAGPNMSRAAVAARPNIRAPKNAGQKGHGSISSGSTANGPKTVRTKAGLPNFEAANAAEATNSSGEDEAEENIEEEDPIFDNVSGEHNVNEAAVTEETMTTKATKVDNMVDHLNSTQPAANAPGFVSSMGAANSRAIILQSVRAKQPIIRPQYPAPVQSSTPPPIPPPRPSQGVSVETIAAASEGTTSRMFQFIPNPGFKHPRQK